jgi:hypothetical protein
MCRSPRTGLQLVREHLHLSSNCLHVSPPGWQASRLSAVNLLSTRRSPAITATKLSTSRRYLSTTAWPRTDQPRTCSITCCSPASSVHRHHGPGCNWFETACTCRRTVCTCCHRLASETLISRKLVRSCSITCRLPPGTTHPQPEQ